MTSRTGTKRKLARGPSLYSFGNSVAQKRTRAAEHGSVSNPFRTAVPHLPDDALRDAIAKIETVLGAPRFAPAQRNKCSEMTMTASEEARRVKEHKAECAYRRSHMVIGANSVTRALEKDALALVLFCPHVKPPHLVAHIAPLAREREVKVVALPKPSTTFVLGRALGYGAAERKPAAPSGRKKPRRGGGMRRVLALGVRKTAMRIPEVAELVDFFVQRADVAAKAKRG
jgi:ribosomal protein L7Ae-like RNA K-turn-binding protein